MNNGFLTVTRESEEWVSVCKWGEQIMGFNL